MKKNIKKILKKRSILKIFLVEINQTKISRATIESSEIMPTSEGHFYD